MRKDVPLFEVSPQNSLRDFILRFPHLHPIVQMVGIHQPYGSVSIREACKGSSTHESVLLALIEACVSEHPSIPESLPTYGLLQFCNVVQSFAELVETEFNQISGEYPKLNGQIQPLIETFTQHKRELQTVLLPHIEHVYELYYSPEYTAHKNNLLQFSIEFFPAVDLPLNEMHHYLDTFENQCNWQDLQNFHRVYERCQVLDRLENKLLKPLVLQMESDIVLSFQRKIERLKRMTYLPVSNSVNSSDPLSKREREVLTYVANGLLNKEIAEQMTISLTTVITHRKNIVKKLRINTMAGLTIYAYTHGYLVNLSYQSGSGT